MLREPATYFEVRRKREERTMSIGYALGLILALGQAPEGTLVEPPSVCSDCGVRSNVILDLVVILQKSPDWHRRERAAHDLRRVDWRCHPEVVGALAYSLLNDPNGEVREEAAESLTKMRPDDPSAIEALKRAAGCDRYRPARRAARRGVDAYNLAARGVIRPNGPLAMTGRLMLLPTRMIQQHVILPPGVLRRPIVMPGVTIESAPIAPPETVIETPISPPPAALDPIPSAKPDAPFAPREPKVEEAPVPYGSIDSKVNPPTDLAPLEDSEKVPAPPEPAPPAEDLIKPLTERKDSVKSPKTTTTRRRVASYVGGQVPAYLPR